MKILIIVTKGEVGGAQQSVLSLARWLHANHEDVHVVFGEGDFLAGELQQVGIPYTRLRHLRRTYSPTKNLLYFFELGRFVRKHKFDVVHFNSSNTLFGAIAVKLFSGDTRTIFTARGLSLIDPNHQASRFLIRIFEMVFRFLFSWVDEIVFVSQTNYLFAKERNLLDVGRVIYNGVNPEALELLEREKARDYIADLLQEVHPGILLENMYVMGSVGRLAYPKNYEFVIRSFVKVLETYPESVLLLIGDGPERSKYENLIRELHLEEQVFLLGEIPHAARFLRAFDLFVLPSIFEGMSVTLLEVLHAGVPILTTRVGGNPEIVREDGRQLYELDNETEFLAKAIDGIRDPRLREKIALYNAEIATGYHIDKTGRGYVSVYRGLE